MVTGLRCPNPSPPRQQGSPSAQVWTPRLMGVPGRVLRGSSVKSYGLPSQRLSWVRLWHQKCNTTLREMQVPSSSAVCDHISSIPRSDSSTSGLARLSHQADARVVPSAPSLQRPTHINRRLTKPSVTGRRLVDAGDVW